MIKIYDTMTRSLRDFVPLTEKLLILFVVILSIVATQSTIFPTLRM